MRSIKLTALLCAAALLGAGGLARLPWRSPLRARPSSSRRRATCSASPGGDAPATIAKLQSLGVHALRIVLYWGDVAPKPNAKQRPHFNQASPAAYHWGAYDPLINTVTALHWTVLLTVTGGPVPRWATRRRPRPVHQPERQGLRPLHAGRRAPLRQAGEALLDLERAQPAAVPAAAVPPRPARLGRRSTAACSSPATPGLKASGNFSGMKVLMGETSPIGVQAAGIPAPLAFLRGVLCLNASYRPVGHCSKLPADGYAQHPYSTSAGPFWMPAQADPQPTTSRSGRSAASSRRSTARRPPARSAPGCRSTSPSSASRASPTTCSGCPLAQQAEFHAISEKLAWSNPRVVSFDQYLLRDDPPAKVARLRVRPRDLYGRREAASTAASACRSW